MAEQLKDGVYWVGAVDWGLKSFHGHELSTHRGSSYNAYVIKDEKNVLVDTVWGPFAEEFMQDLRSVIDPADLDYVVANHAEVDHSGALPHVLREAPNATLVASKRGENSIQGHYHQDWDIQTMETGDSIDIGKNDLVFVEAPMLHWPDSMFTYVAGQNILMPNDAFGQHYATAYRFNDQVNQKELYEEALKYYVNIVNPYSRQVENKIQEVLEMDLAVDMICPSHGVLWRDNPLQIVDKYREWAAQKPEERALVIYDSMWGSTRKMAAAISEGLTERGVPNKVRDAAQTDRNDLMVEVFRARTIAIGSPTFNGGVLPSISPVCTDLKGLKFKNKIGAAFCSYGWSGGAQRLIARHMEEAGFDLVEEPITCKWQPDAENLEECRAYGRKLAEVTKEPAERPTAG